MSWPKILAPLLRRIRLSIGQCMILAVNDDKDVQTMSIQLLDGEVRSDVPRLQEYGFTSVPHKDAEAAANFVGGLRANGIVIAVDDRRYRLKGLESGEVAMYTDEGDKIHFKRGNIIEIHAETKVRMVTPLLEVTGDIKDRVDTNNLTVQQMRDVYDAHTHTGDDGGNTSEPHQPMS